MAEQFYSGTAYVGVVGSAFQDVRAVVSQLSVSRRDGDGPVSYLTPTKGYEGRTKHINNFLESAHDFLFLMDGDMVFPPDALERLRRHGRQYVSGLYFFRRLPTQPIWFEPLPLDDWPQQPMLREIEKGRLHEIGGSGWGCALIHRSVFAQMEPILRGEPRVIEDSMYFWPHDRAAVLRGEETLKVLTGDNDVVGSDLRFCYLARAAGVTLWGDPDVECEHVVAYGVAGRDFNGRPEIIASVKAHHAPTVERMKREHRERVAALGGMWTPPEPKLVRIMPDGERPPPGFEFHDDKIIHHAEAADDA